VGRSDGPTAPQHLRDDGGNRFTNSAFFVFLRLPAGRAATVKYLKELRSFEPLLVRNDDGATRRLFAFVPNPKLPQFPKGTEVALVRRALLIDSSHRVVVSPLTESVQLRAYRAIPDFSTRTLEAALGGGAESRNARSWQAVQEFRLMRALLFSGRAGGLRPVGTDERDFKTGFNAHPWDELEVRFTGQTFTGPRLGVKENCFACHGLPGVTSFNSLQDFHSGIATDGDKRRLYPIQEMKLAEVAGAAVKWKEGRADWTALRKLLAD
jgi:hypothetical protein